MFPRALDRPAWIVILALAVVTGLGFAAQAQSTNQQPTVEIENPEDGATVRETVNITGDSSDIDGDVEHVEVRIDEGTWREASGTSPWNATWDTTLWSAGEHNITARAWDGEDYSDNETISVVVDQPPEITITAPDESATVNGEVNVTGTVEDPEVSLEKVEVRIDDGPWRNATVDGDWWFAWDTTHQSSGERSITARADDGNTTARTTVNVTVDQPPTLTIDSPEENATVAGEVDVTGTVEDPENSLETVQIRVDGGPWQEVDGTSSWTFAWDTSNITEGEHVLTARADDGSHTTTSTLNVTVDDEASQQADGPPAVEITDPEDGAAVSLPVTIQGVLEDPNQPVDRVDVRIDEGSWQPAEGTTSWTFTWDEANASEGEHLVEARSIRQANASSVTTITLHIGEDAQSPEQTGPIQIHEPTDGATVAGEFDVVGTVSLEEEDVSRVEVRIGDGPWTRAEGVANWTATLNASNLSLEVHRITARAVQDEQPYPQAFVDVSVSEKEDLEATASGEQTEDEGQVPELTVETPEARETIGDEIAFAGVVEDPDSDFVRAELRIDDGSWKSVEVPAGERFSTTFPVDDLEPGEHTVTMRAYDGEHLSSEQTVTVEVEEEGQLPTPGPGIVLGLLALAGATLLAGRPRSRA